MNAGPLVALLLVFLTFNPQAWAQRSAHIQGRVIDPSQAAVPDAAVVIVNQESGFRHSVQTSDQGEYAVNSLESGVYKVTVRKDGFRTMIRFNVKVANLEAAQVDFSLSVGAVQETITVEGTATPPGQEDAAIGVQVFREDIQRLPLNGRGVLGMVELSPGTNVTPATRGEAGQFNANGQRPNANYFTVDGASANTGVTAGGVPAQATGGVLPAMSAFGSLDSLLPVEAVDELHVRTSSALSEIGWLPGANVAPALATPGPTESPTVPPSIVFETERWPPTTGLPMFPARVVVRSSCTISPRHSADPSAATALSFSPRTST